MLATPLGTADDVIVLPTPGTTRIDTLCHIFYDGLMYNGCPVGDHRRPEREHEGGATVPQAG